MSAAEILAAVAQYGHIDKDDPDLPGAIATAQEYMADAGVREPKDGSPRFARYFQCLKYIALDFYDRRDAAVEGNLAPNPAFRRLLNQLKRTEPVPESGTEAE